MNATQRGRLYGVGVGPGDPQLLTLKALRVLGRVSVVAFPGKSREDSLAYQIARGALPQLDEKEGLPLSLPMIREGEERNQALWEAAKEIKAHLLEGRDVAYLTLGDVCIYSTFGAMASYLAKEGLEYEMINGVPSFCAAAALRGLPLLQGEEALTILPSLQALEEREELSPGTYVVMKSGGKLSKVREALMKRGMKGWGASRVGLTGEMIYRTLEDLPDEESYFTLVVAKKEDPGRSG